MVQFIFLRKPSLFHIYVNVDLTEQPKKIMGMTHPPQVSRIEAGQGLEGGPVIRLIQLGFEDYQSETIWAIKLPKVPL